MAQYDLNSVTLMGRLVKDSELRLTQGGQALCRFSLAVHHSNNSEGGGVSYFPVTLRGRLGESLYPYLLQGRKVYVTGSLQQERWFSQGRGRSGLRVEADQVGLLDHPRQRRS